MAQTTRESESRGTHRVPRHVAGEPPTAVVSEGSLPTPVKLAKIGVEDTDAAILALKQSVSAQGGRDCKTIAATIAKAGRTAIGVGNSFTKDLTAYFAAGFAQASAVALVNFKDLEPGGSDGGSGTPTGPVTTYSSCRVIQGQLIFGVTQFENLCSAHSGPGGTESGRRIVGSDNISPCFNNGSITVLPFGGSLTSGLDNTAQIWETDMGKCLTDWDNVANRCRRPIGPSYGVLTMNSVLVDHKICSNPRHVGGTYVLNATQQADFNSCSVYSWAGKYHQVTSGTPVASHNMRLTQQGKSKRNR